MANHSKAEREKRKAEGARVEEIQAAWLGSIPPAAAKAFAASVEAARARGPLPKRPDMAPGPLPNPPRPGHEPRKPKEEPRGRGPRRD